MNGNGGMISARFVAREAAKTVMSGPASGVMAAAYTGRRAGRPQPHHLRHGRHLDRRRADPRRASPRSRARSRSTTRCRSTCRWSTCTRSAPAAARSRASTPPACCRSGRKAPAPIPGPICYGRGGTRADHHRRQSAARPARSRSGCWRSTQPVTRGRMCAQIFADRIGRAARPRRRRGGRRRPAPRQHSRWPAPSAWCRCRAATIRATSRCSPSAAPGRCTRRRWRASSASRGAGAGAAGHHQCARLRRRRPAPRFRQHGQPAGRRARRWRSVARDPRPPAQRRARR